MGEQPLKDGAGMLEALRAANENGPRLALGMRGNVIETAMAAGSFEGQGEAWMDVWSVHGIRER